MVEDNHAHQTQIYVQKQLKLKLFVYIENQNNFFSHSICDVAMKCWNTLTQFFS